MSELKADLFDNPMGLQGFDFVEFVSPEPELVETLFRNLGFTHIANHRSKDVALFRQGDINLILNREPKSHGSYFLGEHGAGACSMGFRVKNAQQAYELAIENGAEPVEVPTGVMELRLPAIKGIGGSLIYLIDRFSDGNSIYDIDFEYLPSVDKHLKGFGFKVIDHLTHNVYRGRMAYWADFYERIFNFREIRYFDITGEYTGLTSKAMTAPNDTYYQMLDERLPNHGENVAELQMRGILLDGTTEGGTPRLLLQIFSETILGSPVFFEFIQRKGDYEEGFGEGNFKALFESIERDQVRRGAIGQLETETP